jgi:DNA repair protein RadC
MKQLRERLQCYGSETLSDVELLTLVLCTGPAHDDLSTVIPALLAQYGGLGGLRRADAGEWCQEHHLGTAKAVQLQAVLELSHRLATQRRRREIRRIRDAEDVAYLLMSEMTHLDHEQFRVLVLDIMHQLLVNQVLYEGTLNSANIRIAEVFRPAITRKGAAIIVCHNHPSGRVVPTPEDVKLTERLVAAGRLLEVEVCDHIIIGDQRYLSLKEQMRW